MDIELIIFDWGGTLADVTGQPVALTRGAMAVGRIFDDQAGHAVVEALAAGAIMAEKRAAADPSGREVEMTAFLRDWAEARGFGPSDAQVAEAVHAIGEHWVGGALTPLPGAVEAVRQLHEAGYRLGLLSNCWIPPEYCRQELDRQGFGPLMDFAVFSSQVGFRKPSPTIYDAVLKAAFGNGRPADLSRVLFVGDSPSCDVIGPARLGMKTALVASKPGLWSEADFAAARPDLRVDAVADLPARLGVK